MDENIYEVSRDEYVGFIGQINPAAKTVKEETNEGVKWIKTYSNSSHKLLATREIYLEGENEGQENYYVFEMPEPEERIAPKAIRKITLETKEEVQAFFDALSEVMKKEQEEKDNV